MEKRARSCFVPVSVLCLCGFLSLSCQQSLNVGGNKPSQPTNLVAVAGDGKVALSWDASTDATSYTVYYMAGTGVSVASNDGTKNAGSATTATVAGLADGTTYAFAVTAANSNGTSALSEVKTATPNAAAGSPVVAVTPVDGALILSWPPVVGATSYNVYYKAGSGVTTSDTKIPSVVYTTNVNGDCQYTLGGLTNATAYSVIVTAVNSGGESAPSVATQASPGAGAVALTPGDQSIVVHWAAVSGVDGYNVYWKAGSSVSKASYDGVFKVTSQATTSHTISGLVNWTQYAVVMTSYTNSPSESSEGSTSTATPGVVPAAPAGLAVSATPLAPSTTSLRVSFSASSHADSYAIYWKAGTTVDTASATNASGLASTSYDVTGLTLGTQYAVIAVATNSFGSSAATGIVTAYTGAPPAVPAGLSLSPNSSASTSMDASWSSGSATNPATAYVVCYLDEGAGNASTVISSSTIGASSNPSTDIASTSTTVTGLTHGHVYSMIVYGKNAFGDGYPCAFSYKLLDRAPSAPSPTSPADGSSPSGSTAYPASAAFGVAWSAASDADGGDTLTYVVHYNSGGATSLTNTTSPSASTSATVNFPANAVTYKWYVTAVDQLGVSSVPSATFTVRTGQPAPTSFVVDSAATATWQWKGSATNTTGSTQYFFIQGTDWFSDPGNWEYYQIAVAIAAGAAYTASSVWDVFPPYVDSQTASIWHCPAAATYTGTPSTPGAPTNNDSDPATY